MRLSNAINPRLGLIAVLLLGAIALFAVLVWPTRYRYDHMKVGEDNLLVRTDRLTGKTEFLYQYGWQEFPKPESEKPQQEIPIPTKDLDKLTGQASVDHGHIEVALYNGSDWKITEITVGLAVYQKNQKACSYLDLSAISPECSKPVLSRPYRLRLSGYTADPQENTNFRGDLGFELDSGQTWVWDITAAKGTK